MYLVELELKGGPRLDGDCGNPSMCWHLGPQALRVQREQTGGLGFGWEALLHVRSYGETAVS